jgi:peptide deformylase
MHTILPHDDNPVLREMAREIPKSELGGARLKKIIGEMKLLLSKEEYGVALAAPQIGEPLRLFVVSGSAMEKRTAKYGDKAVAEKDDMPNGGVYINPELVRMSRGKKEKHEGCLSVRGTWGLVPRAEKVTITYLDEDGNKHTRGASGLLAHIFQHELDHLQGILYIDKATKLYTEELTPAAK